MTGKPWTSFDVSILLAWLDFCLQNGKDFESTILQRLREATEQHPGHAVGFTIQQVKNKLISLGRGRKDADSALNMHCPGLREIISKGSVCIPGLTRELRFEIAEAIERFRISFASSQPTIHPAQPPGGQDSPKERSSTQSGCHDGHIRQNLDMHGALRAYPNMTLASPVQGSPGPSNLGGRTLTPNGHSHFEISTSHATPSHSRKTIHIREPQKDGRPWQHLQPLDATKDEAQRLNSLWEAEVTTLYGKIEDLEKRNERLVAGQQIFDNARQKSESSGQDPQESQFRTYLQQLWNLDQLNMNLQNKARFFELGHTQKRSLQAEDIDNTIDKIQSKLQSILDSCDTTTLQLNTAIHPGSDFEALLLSSLDLHHTPQDIEQRLKECISQFEVPVIVRTLVLAAFQDWVFNTSFPPFMGEGATSLFLKSLEEVIMDHTDWAWLRNLETAAYSRFLEKFKIGLLPMRSRLLADRLIKVIATFLIPVSLEETGIADGPKALDNILDLDSLHFELIDMFSAGLEFKAAAGGSDNRYEFIVNPLNIDQTRKAESSGSSQICTSRPWNYASLRVYDAGIPNWLDPRSDAIIQTNNFVPGLSRTKARCIYSRDISKEGSETGFDGSTLQTHNPFSTSVRSQRRILSPTTSVNRSNNLGTIHSPNQRIFGRSNRPTSVEPIDNRPEHCRIDCSSSKQISHPEDQLNRDDDSLSTISSVRDPFEVEINTMRVELESTTTEKAVDEQGADVASKHERSSICGACGTELSCYDSMLRHQKNKSCRRCIICEEMFPTSSALKKHGEIKHSMSNKRRRLSQDHQSTKLVNSETTEPNKKIFCERCGQEFNKITSLQKHTVYKLCLHCYKCSEEFDRASDYSQHMKSAHSLQFIDSRWRRINLVQQVEGQPDMSSKSVNSNGPGSTTQDDHERVLPETRILSPSTSKNAQADAAIGADINLGNNGNEVTIQKSSQAPVENGNHCAICDEWFSNLFSFEKHQKRKCHRDRVRKFKTESAVQRQRISPKSPKNVMTSGAVKDGVSKSRAAKRPRSKAPTEMRREPTPESRHVARIIAQLQKVDQTGGDCYPHLTTQDVPRG